MFDLRYLGQSVADLFCGPKKIILSTTNEVDHDPILAKTNEEYYECDIRPECDLNEPEAKKFFDFFAGKPEIKGGKNNIEHSIENLLRTALENKALPGEPVTIAGVRFSMRTAICASRPNEIRYGKKGKGGWIDILARIGIRDAKNLCIIEVKKDKITASTVLKQAVAYTVFIRELLRSEQAGPKWWKLFGFEPPMPDSLTLYAACAMPGINDKDKPLFGREQEFDLDGDKIQLHYISFKENNNTIETIETSWVNTQ